MSTPARTSPKPRLMVSGRSNEIRYALAAAGKSVMNEPQPVGGGLMAAAAGSPMLTQNARPRTATAFMPNSP